MRHARVYLLMALPLAYSAASHPTTPSSTQRTQTRSAISSQPAQNGTPKQLGTEETPLVVKSVRAIENSDDPAHKAFEHHEKPMLDRWLTWGTVALAVSTFLLFCFTAALWWVTYRLSRDARATSIRQAKEVQDAFAISNESANAAKRSADTAERALTIAQRAFVFGKGFEVGLHTTDERLIEYPVFVDFGNVGTTPATDVRAWIKTETIPNIEQRIPAFAPTDPGPSTVLGPNSTLRSGIATIPVPTMVQVWRGEANVFVWSRIEYRDIFDPGFLHHHEQCVQVQLIHEPSTVPPAGHPSYVLLSVYGPQNTTG
jgi:hypothetical protein